MNFTKEFKYHQEFIRCKANVLLSEVWPKYIAQKIPPFVIVEDKGQFVGVISPREMTFILDNIDYFITMRAQELISSGSKLFSAIAKEEIEKQLNLKLINYAILTDENNHYVAIMSLPELDESDQDTPNHQSLQQSFAKNALILQEQQKLSNMGNWEYNFEKKELIISDEFMDIFELPKDINIYSKDTNSIYKMFLQFIDTNNKELFSQVHKNLVIEGHEFFIKYRIRTEEGKLKYLQEHCKVIRDANNEPRIAIGTIQDITQMSKLELSTWQYKEQFNEMFNNSADSIFIINILQGGEYRFHRVNAACEKVTGMSNEEFIGAPISTLFPGETGKQMIDSLNRCIRENQSIHFEIELTFPSGRKYFATTLSPMRSQNKTIMQIIGVAVDITDKKHIEENVRHLNGALLALNSGNVAISQASTESELIQLCCESITRQNGFFPVCCVLEVVNNPKQLLNIYTMSGNRDLLFLTKLDGSDELLGKDCILKSIFSKKPQTCNIVPKGDKIDENQLNSVLALPLIAHERVNFVFVIYSRETDEFKTTEIAMFQELGKNIILGIEHQRILSAFQSNVFVKEQQAKQLKESLQKTISALGTMLEHRDPFTAGHQKRVAHLAVTIAQNYGLEPERIHWLELAACVHDIGKITIPSEILSKPSKLSAPEFAMIKSHPEVGYQILKDIDFPGPIAEIVHQHHEYLDGSGYPFGLKENEIMVEAKILTVADIVEAMASHRPYRPSIGIEQALNEIKKMSGKKLDPKIVNICVKLFENNDFHFLEVDQFNQTASLKMSDLSRS